MALMNKILPISEHVASQLASSKQIRDLRTAVLGLLENSLDAGSSRIEISVNFPRRSCKIEDNGSGIAAQEFEEQGGLCKRHHTSKQDLVATGRAHSCDGTFLTSLATLSLLSITSKINGGPLAHLSLHHGQLLTRSQKLAQELIAFPAHGTRVFVDDMFGSLPVRVKQYALSADDCKAQDKYFDQIKQGIVAMLLAWPEPVTVRLQDSSSRVVILSASHPSVSHALTSRALSKLHQAPHKFSVHDKLPLLFQAGLASAHSREQWIPVSASSSRYSLRGLICLTPAPSTRCQFISIGVISLGSIHDVLYQTINKLFSDSVFGMIYDREPHRTPTPAAAVPIAGSTRKGVDKWPMFVININSSLDATASTSTHPANLSRLLRLVEQLVRQWLTVHDFHPKRGRRTRNEMQTGPSAVASLSYTDGEQVGENATRPGSKESLDEQRPAKPYTQPWTSIRTAKALSIRHQTTSHGQARSDLSQVDNVARRHAAGTQHRLPVPSGLPNREDVDLIEQGPVQIVSPRTPEASRCDNKAAAEYVEWQDSVTRRNFLLNLHTGMTIEPSSRRRNECRPVGPFKNTETDAKPRLSKRNFARFDTCPNKPAIELPQSLRAWQPRAFAAPSEQPIPRPDFNHDALLLERSLKSHAMNATIQRLTKVGLRHAKVIAQVDNKFILCTLPANAIHKAQLILIDQHAASERVLLEGLLVELCIPVDEKYVDVAAATKLDSQLHEQWASLDRPIIFEITAQEAMMLQEQTAHFARWGIVYDVSCSEPHISASQVRQPQQQHRISVRGLPRIIAERCRSSPKILIEMLRNEIWEPTRSAKSSTTSKNDRSTAWLRLINTCPKGILDMVTSRACRSAIMFNDPLTLVECEALVEQVSATIFPFMCAHGRTSAVPLLELAHEKGSQYANDFDLSGFEATEHKSRSFAAAYTQWTT